VVLDVYQKSSMESLGLFATVYYLYCHSSDKPLILAVKNKISEIEPPRDGSIL
jgi:hypothetical protein